MRNMIKKKPGEFSWVTWIKKRIDHNLNFLSITTGPTGSGKSYADMSIAYQIDKDFDVHKQVAFSFTSFMKIINGFNGDDKELSKKKYKVVVFDEVQVTASKREWQSKVNKLFNYIISTFRHQNIIVLFNSPYSDFVDINTMKLIHAKFETRGWSKKRQKTAIKGKILQYNDKLSKFYEHSLFVINNGKVNKFAGLWLLPKPPEHLIQPYERMKTEFTHRLNKKITKEIEEMEQGLNSDDNDNKQELNPESMQPAIWEEAQKGYSNQEELKQRLSKKLEREVDIGQLNRNITSMRKKGYDIRQYKGGVSNFDKF